MNEMEIIREACKEHPCPCLSKMPEALQAPTIWEAVDILLADTDELPWIDTLPAPL